MSYEYRARAFRSGNSVALRLPKALGIVEGSEMLVRQNGRSLAIELLDKPKPRIDVSGFWGKVPGLKLPPREDFEERPSTVEARARSAEQQAHEP